MKNRHLSWRQSITSGSSESCSQRISQSNALYFNFLKLNRESSSVDLGWIHSRHRAIRTVWFQGAESNMHAGMYTEEEPNWSERGGVHPVQEMFIWAHCWLIWKVCSVAFPMRTQRMLWKLKLFNSPQVPSNAEQFHFGVLFLKLLMLSWSKDVSSIVSCSSKLFYMK